jgi:NAD(P)-dependent dehydrogenase (short-subunit alcohol dehydrogenase family)
MLRLNPKNYHPDEKNKIALVRGANRGLGFETCLQLAQLGLTVIILSARDLIKAFDNFGYCLYVGI